MCRAGSLRLDVRRPDYLAPLLGFVSDEFAKVGGREHECRAPLVDKSRLDLGVGEAGVYLLVETCMRDVELYRECSIRVHWLKFISRWTKEAHFDGKPSFHPS